MNLRLKILNWSVWIVIISTYILPYQTTDGFATTFGYPLTYLTVYKTDIHVSLLMSNLLNPFTFFIDVLIVYFLINFVYSKLKKSKPV
jgi:hypothetical protein